LKQFQAQWKRNLHPHPELLIDALADAIRRWQQQQDIQQAIESCLRNNWIRLQDLCAIRWELTIADARIRSE
jgi:hypothetical protein